MLIQDTFSKSFKSHILESWSSRSQINNVERYLFSTYLKDSSLSLLEAGSGSGVLAFHLEKHQNFKKITGFDIIPEMIQIAQQKAKDIGSNIIFNQADASGLSCFDSAQFEYLVYLQQILSMIPENKLDKSLEEAFRVGTPDATYIFSFLDWNSRWFNPILSFSINCVRLLTRRPIQRYYIPELKFQGGINREFYKKEQHAIFWAKKESLIKKLKLHGFRIVSIYDEETLTKHKGRALYFVCKKEPLPQST